MMEYYQRMLLSENETKKEELDVPVLTIISLGGNDYNHQNGKVPSQEETSQGFARFISEKIGLNNENPNLGKRKVLLICGMGWPQEETSQGFARFISEKIGLN